MAECRLNNREGIRQAILDNVNDFLARNRYTISRISDSTFRVNGNIDNSKSKVIPKEGANKQAYQIARTMVDRVKKEYYGHVDGYINETSPYDAITVTFVPSEAYIDHEFAKIPPEQGEFFQAKEEKLPSKASQKTLDRVKEFLRLNKIDIKQLAPEYQSINGVAHLWENVIEVAEGKENVALTEEASHFIVELLENNNPQIFNQMLSKIGNYKIYQDVLTTYSPLYRTKENKPDIRKIKKEAMARVLAEYIIKENEGDLEKPENIAQTLGWWDQIKQWVRNLLKIAGFNPFEETAKQLTNLTGEINSTESFLQVNPNATSQDEIATKLKQTDDNIQKVYKEEGDNPLIGEEANNWYERKLADGTWQRVKKRVTDRIKAFYNQIFRNKTFTKDEVKFNELKRNTGVDGHSDVENIIRRFVDENGDPKANPDSRPQASQIAPGDTKMVTYDKLETFIKDLLASYQPGTKFFPEAIIYDEAEDEAGTIDLLVIEPNGKTSIFDWKFIGKNNQEDIAGFKQGAYDKQIGRYKQILKTRYGVKDFGMTRAIPILMDFRTLRLLDGEEKTFLAGIAIGTFDARKIEDLKLLPVPTTDEETLNPGIDAAIKKLNALYERELKKKPIEEEERQHKRDILTQLRVVIRLLQTQQNVAPIVDGMELYLEGVDKTFEDYDEFRKKDPKDPNLTEKEINDMADEILDTIAVADAYKNMDVALRDLTDDPELKVRLTEEAFKVKKAQERLNDIRQDLVDKFLGERNNIFNVNSDEKTMKGLSFQFDSLSQLPTKALQLLVAIYRRAKLAYQRKAHDYNKEILDLTSQLDNQKEAYNLLFQKDKEGRRIHKLVDEINPEFGKEMAKQSTSDNFTQWLKDNIDYDAYQKDAKAIIEEKLKTISGPNADNRKAQLYARYDATNEQFVGKNELVWKHANRDKWETKEFKELAKNEPLLKLYRKAQEINNIAAEAGFIDYMQKRTFIGFYKKGLLDKIWNGGNIRPIQDFVDGLSASDAKSFGVVDELTGQKRYSLPKYGTVDIGVEKKDEKGQAYKDYSDISSNIGQILVAYSQQVFRFQEFSNITSQIKAVREMETLKGHIATNSFDVPLRDEKGKPVVEKGNEANTKAFDDFTQYLVYGNKYPLSDADADTGIGKVVNYGKKLINNITKRVSGKIVFPEGEEVPPSSMIKMFEALNRGTQLKILGLAPISTIANASGLVIQAAAQLGKYFTFGDYSSNSAKITFQRFRSREDRDTWAQLLDHFLPLSDDPSREIYKKLGNKFSGENVTDALMIGFNTFERRNQGAVFMSLLDNTIVVNGKLENIFEHVRKAKPERYKNPQEYKEYKKNFDKQVEDLPKQSLLEIAEMDNGELVIPGFDLKNLDEIRKLSTLSKTIANKISGSMSEEDISRANMNIFMRSMMVFHNWIAPLVKTRFGKFSKANDPGDADSYDIGRVRLFWKVLMEHMSFRIGAIRNILQVNEKGLLELDKLYKHYSEDYQKRTGQEFTMNQADFNDMIIQNIRNQTRELAMLLSMVSLFIATGFIEPPDDPQTKSVLNFSKRTIDQIINELSFYYNPVNFQNLLSGNMFPALGMVTDTEKFFANLGAQVTGLDFSSKTAYGEETRDAAQPLKYFLKLNPGARQFVIYMSAFAPDMAKEMDIKPPAAQSY